MELLSSKDRTFSAKKRTTIIHYEINQIETGYAFYKNLSRTDIKVEAYSFGELVKKNYIRKYKINVTRTNKHPLSLFCLQFSIDLLLILISLLLKILGGALLMGVASAIKVGGINENF